MTVPTLDTVSPESVVSDDESTPACPACAHPVAAHDPIGLRFCRATTAGGFDRGCVCRLG